MRDCPHPAPDLLRRFLQGEAASAERRAVVRHLLAGCRQCAAAIQAAWEPAPRPARRGGMSAARPLPGRRGDDAAR